MAIPAMALLQQHDARQDILIEPAARRHAAIEARGHLELGRSELGTQSGRKKQPACLYVCLYVMIVSLQKWPNWPFGICTGVGPRNYVLDGHTDPHKRMGSFEGKKGPARDML